jgi:hypothetical protein
MVLRRIFGPKREEVAGGDDYHLLGDDAVWIL